MNQSSPHMRSKRYSTINFCFNFILAISMVATSATCCGQGIVNWIDASGGFFDVGSNWSTGTMPGTADSATFSIPGTYDVDWDGITGDVTTDDLFVLNGDVAFRSLGSASGGTVYNYTVNDDLTVGIGATLRIGDGSDGMNLIVGDEMLVDAAELRCSRNGSLTAMGTTDIGSSDNASGFLNLQDTQFDANGIVRAGIGENAQGRIVAADETLANTTNVDIGVSPSGNGRLEVIGENTVWNSTSELDIGEVGRGVMEIRLGATVNSEISAVGWQAGGDGSVTIRHTGSSWNVETRLDIGAVPGAVGTLLLEEAGSASVFGTDLTIGAFTTTPGCEVTVRDPGSVVFVNEDLLVGGLAGGTLNISNDANVLAMNNIQIRSLGTVNVSGNITQGLTGGSLQNEGMLTLMQGAHVNITSLLENDVTGTITMDGLGIPKVEAGTIVNDGAILLSFSSDVVGNVLNNGIIESTGAAFNILFGDLVNSGSVNTTVVARTRIRGATSGSGAFTGSGIVDLLGPIRPGADHGNNVPGTLSFGGHVAMGLDSTFEVELGGVAGSQFDRATIEGDLDIFGSSLVVSSLGSFTPSMGDEFLIVETDGNQTGVFNGLLQGALVTNLNGQNLFIDYTAGDGNDIALTTTSVGGFLLGDINLDGAVNLLDVAPFVDLVANGVFQVEADINQDGIVNLLDVGPFVALLSGN